MASRSYWLDLFTGTTWKEFVDAVAVQVSGFRESRWKTVQKMRPGDYLLCYLTRRKMEDLRAEVHCSALPTFQPIMKW